MATVSPKRVEELEATLDHCTAKRLYVTAFLDFRQFKRHVNNIAWETEVWIAEIPDHLIHIQRRQVPRRVAELA